MIFVSIAMAKEGLEDLRRFRLDKSENNSEISVLRDDSDTQASGPPKSFTFVKWHALQVGDVVRLARDEPAPADLVLLRSTGPNSLAYIETMALDGETNLKTKQPAPALVRRINSTEDVAGSNVEFVVEDPNLDLYNFEGRVIVGDEVAPLTNTEVIYRGSVLRNTPEVLGMVIYTGEECKIRMNANKNPRIKAPMLQSIVNKIVVMMVCFVVGLSLFNSGAYEVWRRGPETDAWYLINARVPFGHVLVSFIIMFNTLIPLSVSASGQSKLQILMNADTA
jgi:phospholipid-translocating ATPase